MHINNEEEWHDLLFLYNEEGEGGKRERGKEERREKEKRREEIDCKLPK